MASATKLRPQLQERVPLPRTLWKLADLAVLFLLLALLARRASALVMAPPPCPWCWLAALICEAWFTVVWLINMNAKWNPVRFDTHPERLAEWTEELPAVDMFVTTADPKLEPTLVTVNTVLSLLALDYPAGKLACYVSDDGCSPVTCYALLEAAEFAKLWVPFCKEHSVSVRAPFVYFSSSSAESGGGADDSAADEFLRAWTTMKNEYEKLVRRIENAEEEPLVRRGDGEFAEFVGAERRNHPTIVKVLWDNTNSKSSNNQEGDGNGIPSLIYISREKSPKQHHHFKAGAMNVLTRVSAVGTNAPIMLNVDCDMFANNPQVALHAMCLLLGFDDEVHSGFVQAPQKFYAALKDDPFGNQLQVTYEPDDIDPTMVPKLGQHFKSIKEAHAFYARYAKKVRFGIKKYREKHGCKWLNCVREGRCKPKLKNPMRSRKKFTKRVGCLAGMKLRKEYADDGTISCVVIDHLNLYHNHGFPPSPTANTNFHCNKNLDPSYLEYISRLQASRVPEYCILDHMAEMHGGPEHVMVTRKDLANMKAAQTREDQADDVPKLLEFFNKCKQENPQFYCDFQLDKDNKIVSIFWSYASMQGEYADFGDAVTFDTTHKTNLYKKPLAMFVGANHHLQCTVFGIALLGDESTETFEWVFKTFKACMRGKAPQCILTDQDPAMPEAIRVVFPDTIHRLCLWHVINKYQPLLNVLYARFKKEEFKEKFQSVVHHPLTPKEFESAWEMLLKEFDLHCDETLQALYANREEWVPCYFKDEYGGIMSSTQRSESVNHIVKKCHVDANTPLHLFAKQMVKFIHRRKMSEATETYGCMSEVHPDANWPFEVRVGRAYTRAVFARFEETMKKATAYRVIVDTSEGEDSWLVQHTNHSNKLVWGQHQFQVKVDIEKQLLTCECKMLEHTGLFCVHLLRTFMHIQLESIPSKYVLRRYCRNARSAVPFDRTDRKMKGADGQTKAERQNMVLPKAMTLVRFACQSQPALDRTMDGIDDLIRLVSGLEPDIGVGDIDVDDEEDIDEQPASHGANASNQPEGHTAASERQCDEHAPQEGSWGAPYDSIDRNLGDMGDTNGISLQPECTQEHATDGASNGGLPAVTVTTTSRCLKYSRATAKASLEIGIGISLQPPDNAKPKGRKKEAAELTKLKLGAKGPKKSTRRCLTCGIKDGHNSSTCLQVEANRIRLANLSGKKRGRPPGSKNRCNNNKHPQDGEHDGMKERRVVLYADESDDMQCDGSDQPDEPSPLPRKRGRPLGVKNKNRHLKPILK